MPVTDSVREPAVRQTIPPGTVYRPASEAVKVWLAGFTTPGSVLLKVIVPAYCVSTFPYWSYAVTTTGCCAPAMTGEVGPVNAR